MLAQRLEDRLSLAAGDRRGERVLAGEVVVEQRAGDARIASDGAHGCAEHALARKVFRSHLKNLLFTLVRFHSQRTRGAVFCALFGERRRNFSLGDCALRCV